MMLGNVMTPISRSSLKVRNYPSPFDDTHEYDPDSRVPCTPEKLFDELDGQSDDSQFNTPAQPSTKVQAPSFFQTSQKE
jgi:hypothetical protein